MPGARAAEHATPAHDAADEVDERKTEGCGGRQSPTLAGIHVEAQLIQRIQDILLHTVDQQAGFGGPATVFVLALRGSAARPLGPWGTSLTAEPQLRAPGTPSNRGPHMCRHQLLGGAPQTPPREVSVTV